MVEYALSELFRQDSVDKQIDISFDDVHITNSDFRGQDFELTESLCSESELRFGCCEASVLKFKISNTFEEMCGKWLTVRTILEHNVDNPFQFGKYKVNLDEVSGDKSYRSITAYDAMYDIINAEMVTWYDGLTFPVTQKEFRDSFFAQLCVEQEETTLIQDDMLIEKTIDADSISGKQIITALCELNGVFGHINRQGVFVYVSLADKTGEILYPSIELYPSDTLYSAATPYNNNFHSEIVKRSGYISCEYEDFNTSFITRLQIRQEAGDVGAVVGEGTNAYIIEDNFLVYGKSPEDLETIAKAVFEKIQYIQYRPFRSSLHGNLCVEVGDAVVFHTRYKDVESYVLERTIKGIQSLKDSFESKGVYEYEEKVNSVNKEVKRLKGKTNILTRTVEKLVSLITDEETGLQSQISQTANSIKSYVKKGDVSSEISQEADIISIKGNRIAIESNYFTLTKDGKIAASSAIISGQIISDNPDTQRKTVINDGFIYTYGTKNDSVLKVGSIASFYGGDDTENTDGWSFVLEPGADALAFGVRTSGDKFNTKYYINNGYNPDGYTERHIWYEDERHFGNAYFNKNICKYGYRNDGTYALTGYLSAFRKTSETTYDNDGFCIITVGDCIAMGIGDTEVFSTYYYLNNGYNPEGYTYRHIWYGSAFFNNSITTTGTMYVNVGSDYLGLKTDGAVKCNKVTTEQILLRNANLSTDGYYSVPTCGTGHTIHFNWNGSNLVVWVDVTQIGYVAFK